MFQQITEYFLFKPRRLQAVGSFFAYLGLLMLAAGVIGHVLVSMTTVAGHLSGRTVTPPSLAELYSPWLTWWIPESIVGAVPGALFISYGFWVIHEAKRLERSW